MSLSPTVVSGYVVWPKMATCGPLTEHLRIKANWRFWGSVLSPNSPHYWTKNNNVNALPLVINILWSILLVVRLESSPSYIISVFFSHRNNLVSPVIWNSIGILCISLQNNDSANCCLRAFAAGLFFLDLFTVFTERNKLHFIQSCVKLQKACAMQCEN